MENVLLLNATYAPIQIISYQRAVCLMVSEVAELIESVPGKMVRSPSTEIPWPSVIKLRSFCHLPFDRTVALNKKNIITRDKGECAYCIDRKADSIDHIIPRGQGGSHTFMNTIASCKRCNNNKGNRTPREAGLKLRFQPTVPNKETWIKALTERNPSWKEYAAYV